MIIIGEFIMGEQEVEKKDETIDSLVKTVSKLADDIELIKKRKPMAEIVEECDLERKDFDVNKDDIIDPNEEALYQKYESSNRRIIEYAEKSVVKSNRTALISNIILGIVFLVQQILMAT